MKGLNIFVLKMMEMVSAGYGGYQELWSCHDNNNQQTLSRRQLTGNNPYLAQ